MSVTREDYARLAEKYNRDTLWYIEYPHKKFWEPMGDTDFRAALGRLHVQKSGVPLMLYLHIPYCEQMCYFCVCHFRITQDYKKVNKYLEYLFMEIQLLVDFFKENKIVPNFQELHLGGGSPTYLHETEFDQLLEKVRPIVDIENLREFAIEIDPRRVDLEKVKFYHSRGINRISFGVQDFDLAVQEAVNRIQPAELTERLLTPEIRRLFSNGINFDIICGLPLQTTETFRRTIEKVVELAPDRVSLTYMTYSPWNAKHQTLMSKYHIPDFYERKLLYLVAHDLLLANGYIRSGFDHFAKKTDLVAEAKERGKMTWNSFGFTPGECVDIIALGEHSYSTIGDAYFQNYYEQEKYFQALSEKKFPIFRGHECNDEDLLRKDVIKTLRGYFRIDIPYYDDKYGIKFNDYFAAELTDLVVLQNDGLVEVKPDRIEITEIGQQFANVICEVFDIYLRPVKEKEAFLSRK